MIVVLAYVVAEKLVRNNDVSGAEYTWPWTYVPRRSYTKLLFTDCLVACGAFSSPTGIGANISITVQDLSLRTDSLVLQGCEPEQA